MPFHDLVGHRHLVALLARAAARGSLPPALLLAGPDGVGKRRSALALAQALNCREPVAAGSADEDLECDACGACSACRRIAAGTYPDVLVIEPGETGSIRIDQVRTAIDGVGYRPFEGRRRVVIVDDAEALVPQAQHALLKTLEEPPSTSVFVLVSATPDALLPTARSRCSRLRFPPLTTAEVAAVLVRDHGVAAAESEVLAAAAEGSVRLALALEAADLAAAREMARDLLDRAARTDDLSRRLDAIKGLGGRKRNAAEERVQLAACLRAASSMLRDVSALEAGVDPSLVIDADRWTELARLGAALGAGRAIRAFRTVDEALGALGRNANPKVVADWLAVRL